MRVVLDANVLIAAVAGRGLCESVLELCLEEHDVIICRELMDEVHRKLVGKIKLAEGLAAEFCRAVRDNAITAAPASVPRDACRDGTDLYLLGLCESGRADVLVTGDKDLLACNWEGVAEIVDPRQFWEKCRQK